MMKRMLRRALVLALLMSFACSAGLAWGPVTHAYIGQQLKKQNGPYNLEEIYGFMSPDMFNYLFQIPYVLLQPYLQNETHVNFMKLWNAVKRGYEKSVGYGFLGHNDVWGADLIAHHPTAFWYDPDNGYIISKAKALHQMLLLNPGYAYYFGDPALEPVAIEICHNLIEAAADILIIDMDPQIGDRMVKATSRSYGPFQELLVRAYAADLSAYSQYTPIPLDLAAAGELIRGSEWGFRAYIGSMGSAFKNGKTAAYEFTVTDFTNLAEAYLALYGIGPIDPALLDQLIPGALDASFYYLLGDYPAIVNTTVAEVNRQLKLHKIE